MGNIEPKSEWGGGEKKRERLITLSPCVRKPYFTLHFKGKKTPVQQKSSMKNELVNIQTKASVKPEAAEFEMVLTTDTKVPQCV